VDASAPNIELGVVAPVPNRGTGRGCVHPNLELGVVAPGPNRETRLRRVRAQHRVGHSRVEAQCRIGCGHVHTQLRVGRGRARAHSWDGAWTCPRPA
jgi:hypothetical protein